PRPFSSPFPYTTLFRSTNLYIDWRDSPGVYAKIATFRSIPNPRHKRIPMITHEPNPLYIANPERYAKMKYRRCGKSGLQLPRMSDRKSTRLNSSHVKIS